MQMRRVFLAVTLVVTGTSLRAADKTPTPDRLTPQTETINRLITAKWMEAGIKKPADKAKDAEFLRRAFIDLLGRIPTIEECKDFEGDGSSNKRIKLIHRLLYSSEYQPKVGGMPAVDENKKKIVFSYSDQYAEHWANLWTIWLMSRTAHKDYREKMNYWLEGQLANNVSYRDMVGELLTATGANNKNGAVNFVMFHLGEKTPDDKKTQAGPFDAVPITSRVTRLFLGLQTQCTQCHDHPFNKEWNQPDFWGVNAFFRQTNRSGNIVSATDRQMMTDPPALSVTDEPGLNPDTIVFYERRDGKLMAAKPEFLKDVIQAEKGEKSGKLLQSEGTRSRRQQLAEYVTRHDNFGKAYVNRIWGHLFGRGLNKEASVDDFGSNNEVIHPELLDELARNFANYQYDMKQLLFWICTSDAYGLSHVGPKEYVDPKFDAYFARMPLKGMSPEVLYESLKVATKADDDANRETRRGRRQSWEEKLVRTFGDDEGNEMTFNGTMIQALLMMNGPDLNSALSRTEATNPLITAIQKHAKNGVINGRAVIEDLFLMTLSRRPTDNEVRAILSIRDSGAKIQLGSGEAKPTTPTTPPKPATTPVKPIRPMPMPKQPGPARNREPVKISDTVPPSGPNDQTFYLDVFWALINTNEFMLNH
jgi:hypothetical protein